MNLLRIRRTTREPNRHDGQRSPRGPAIAALAALLVLAGSSFLAAQPRDDRSERRSKQRSARLDLGADITGTLVGAVEIRRLRGSKKKLPAGGVTVTLQDPSGRILDEVKTSGFGDFRFAHRLPGKYRVCWSSAGWGKGCAEPFELERTSIALQVIELDSRQFNNAVLEDLLAKIIDRLRVTNRCEANGSQRFLVKRRNSFDADPVREEEIGLNYYEAIDPHDQRLTLGDWWSKNGFDPETGDAPAESNGYDAAHVSYLNDNDLGFGRDMHCLKQGANVACWVANHGAADQDPGNADLAAAGENPGATVTMEFRQPPSAFRKVTPLLDEVLRFTNRDLIGQVDLSEFLRNFAKIVTFYAYAPDSDGQAPADFGRIVAADLDGCGDKFIPGLCLNCHGGTVPYAISGGDRTNWTSDDLLEVGAASFREFDHATYKFPGDRATVNVVEEAMFYTLNQLVLDTNPVSGIEEVIDGWYASGTTLDTSFAPAGWQGAPSIYTDIVGRYCRTCHIAFDEARNWNEETELYSLNYYLCDEQSMPHAAVTYFNMTDAERDTLLGHYNEDLCN